MKFKHPHKYGLMALVKKKDNNKFDKYRKELKNFVKFFMGKNFFDDIAPQHISLCYFSYPEKYSEKYISKLVPKIVTIIKKFIPIKIKVKGLIGWWEKDLGVPAILWNITDLGKIEEIRKELMKKLAPNIEHFKDAQLVFTPHIGVALGDENKFEEIKNIIDKSKNDKEQELLLDRFYIFYPNKPKEIFNTLKD